MLRTLWVWTLLLAWAAPALAQGDAAQERAKKFFIQGSKDFEARRFARALDAFEQANAIKPHPIMLKNIAKTYEAMKDLPKAVEYYQKYLGSKPGDAGDVQKKIAGLQALMAQWSKLTLTTEPAGASIWVGPRTNRPRGKTPATIVVEPGRQTITLGLAGHDVISKALTLSAGQALTLPVITLNKQKPQVRIASDPAGASVFVDGAETPAGRTPLTLQLPEGEHALRFELEGHRSLKHAVTLGAQHVQAPLRTAVKLEVGKPTGELVIELARGEVLVDGKSIGKAPIAAPIELEEGMHAIEVRGAGEPYREMVTIRAGEQTRTSIDVGGGGGPGFSIKQDTVGWILMGTGGALVVGGVITSFLALGADGDLQDCRDDPTCAHTDREITLADDVRSSALTTDILFGVGVAVAATGAVVYLMADDEPARKTATGVPSVGVTPLRGGGAAAIGRFEF